MESNDVGDDLGYDLENEKANTPPGPVPSGHYTSCIAEIKKKRNSSDTGNLVNIVWEILEGEFAGRKIYEWNINVDHTSTKCQQIGRGRIKTIGLACGIVSPQSYQEFVGVPVRLKIDVEPNERDTTGQYPYQNVAKHCTPLEKGSSEGRTFDGSSLRDKIGASDEPEKMADDVESDTIPF